MVYNGQGDGAGLRGYVQLSKRTHILPYKQTGDSVHMGHTEGVTRVEKQDGAHGIGGGIEVGGEIGHGNGVGGENGDVNGDGGGPGVGTRTKVEVNEGTPNRSGEGSGMGAGTGTWTGV